MRRKLIIKKSFSKVDNVYIQLFKHKTKLSNLSGQYKIGDLIKNDKPKKVEKDKNEDSTSAKLNLILKDIQRSNSYITNQFYEDMTIQNENDDLRQRMQMLYKRRQLRENGEKVEEKEIKNKNIYGTQEAIKHMLYLAKKYAVDKEIARIKTEQNKKSPPICKYSPNLNYISKHIPAFYFGYHKSTREKEKEIMNENNRSIKSYIIEENKNESKFKINNRNDEKLNKTDNLLMTENNNSKSIYNSKTKSMNSSISNKIQKIKIIKNIFKQPIKLKKEKEKELKIPSLIDKTTIQEEKEPIKLNNDLTGGKNTFNAKRHSIFKRNIPNNLKMMQNRVKYNISVPIFNKMTSRENKHRQANKNHNNFDYSPNYDAIFPSNYKYNSIKEKLKKKKYKLRKILGSYNPNGEYVLLPILNKS